MTSDHQSTATDTSRDSAPATPPPGAPLSGVYVPLYTAAQRKRRDASKWTLVQGLLAPFQFLVFAVSLVLVLRVLMTGEGAEAAAMSILLKTLVLYTIMYTGALWEHDVYGQYLFAPAFYWEDMVSLVVIGLHTLYVLMYFLDIGSTTLQLWIALAAYFTYVINATQFLLKLRAARLGEARHKASRQAGTAPVSNANALDAAH